MNLFTNLLKVFYSKKLILHLQTSNNPAQTRPVSGHSGQIAGVNAVGVTTGKSTNNSSRPELRSPCPKIFTSLSPSSSRWKCPPLLARKSFPEPRASAHLDPRPNSR